MHATNCTQLEMALTNRTFDINRRLWIYASKRLSTSSLPSVHNSRTVQVIQEEPSRVGERVAAIALVGAPNAGKSTLLNRIVGARVAAVSRKINTTRRLVRGVYTEKDAQLLMWDTPGVVERHTHGKLGLARRDISTTGWRAALDADVTVVVVDASRGGPHMAAVATILRQLGSFLRARKERDDKLGERNPHALLLALNKCDRVRPRKKLLDSVAFFNELLPQTMDSATDTPLAEPIHLVSAYSGQGVNRLRDSLLLRARPGSFECNPEVATDEDDAEIIEQHIWEKMLHRLHQEIPYDCGIEFEDLQTVGNESVAASVVIRVPQQRHIPIVVGPQGGLVKWIAESASESSSAVLKKKVYLRIRVAIKGGQV